MTIEQLKDQLPDYAKDLRLNLESVLTEGGSSGLDASLTEAMSTFAARPRPLQRHL